MRAATGSTTSTSAICRPTLLDRYVSAAQKVSRLAIGSTQTSMQADTIRLPADRTQETHVDGLPLGTRGGVSIPYTFAQDGEYEIQVWLARDLSGNIGGLRERSRSHEMVVLIDREPEKSFTIQKLVDDDTTLDKDLKVRVHVSAGPHDVGVTFINDSSSLLEAQRQPLLARFNERRHPRTAPAVDQVSISGPYEAKGAADTPSRRRIFVCRPRGANSEKELDCAKTILSTLMRRAYRRPVSKADIEGPLAQYREGRASGDFDAGISRALSAVLINPEFLFPRRGRSRRTSPPAACYRISDLELASRLSFFLWSSIPDDELLDVAIRGRLSRPKSSEKQTRRMLADRRSFNLASNFAGQWLRLRNLDAVVPSTRFYPEFDDNIREGFRQETELFVDSIVREDRSVLDLIRADYTFLNERLAKYYDIPNVYGSHFRRVAVGPETRRGGLLRQGSVLSVTSYATRTSPIIRGVYVLDNILGAPPPPPLPNVPALDEGTVSASLPMRERLAAHRKNAVCASCHRTIDPVGFALENFNAVGQWRSYEGRRRTDRRVRERCRAAPNSAACRDSKTRCSAARDVCSALTEKLLTFGLGRGVEYYGRAGGPQDRARRRRRQVPLLVDHPGYCEEHTVSNEEIQLHDHHEESACLDGRF
jgi:hypothetical protein